jgi:hypothetical protein
LFLIGALPVSGEWDLSGIRLAYFDLIPYLAVPFTNPETASSPLPPNPISGRFFQQLANSLLMVVGFLQTLGVYLSKEASPLSVDYNHTAKPLYYGGFLKVLRENIPNPKGVIYIGKSAALYNLLKLTTSPIFPYKLREKPNIDPFPFVGITDVLLGHVKPFNVILPGDLTLPSMGSPVVSIPVVALEEIPTDLNETWPVFVLNTNGRPDLVPKQNISSALKVVGIYSENPNETSDEIVLGGLT